MWRQCGGFVQILCSDHHEPIEASISSQIAGDNGSSREIGKRQKAGGAAAAQHHLSLPRSRAASSFKSSSTSGRCSHDRSRQTIVFCFFFR